MTAKQQTDNVITDTWRKEEIAFIEKMRGYADTPDGIAERAKEQAKFELKQAKWFGLKIEKL